MKEQILELIHKELENVGGENIFHYCNTGSWYTEDYYSPHKKSNFNVKTNCDGSEKIEVELLNFTLEFEDGEPSIRIQTIRNYQLEEVPYKTKWFGFKKFLSIITTYKFTTKITCGHIEFELSNEETDELLKLTKESYAKYLSLKDKARDKEVSKKIKKRLKKYENKIR
jgi:hypothetical protein